MPSLRPSLRATRHQHFFHSNACNINPNVQTFKKHSGLLMAIGASSKLRIAVIIACVLGAICEGADKKKPHIVWIVADDLGWDDVGFTGSGSNIRTPTLNQLAKEGVVLHNYYVNPLCTPSRASFLTGKYPIHVGLQHGVILDSMPSGLPLGIPVISEELSALGYRTHMVGKWHLGFFRPEYTPTRRGFDTFYGYYTGNEEYWNHTSPCWGCGNYTALDLQDQDRDVWKVDFDQSGFYSTNLFGEKITDIIKNHDEGRPLFLYAPFQATHGAASCDPDCYNPYGDLLQAPQKYIDQQSQISDMYRRTYAGMVGALDEAVRNITFVLKERGMWNNTLLIFTSDNGAPASHFNARAMSNAPLRGQKGELWEGGVRGAAFVTGYGLKKTGYFNRGLMHATDWYPTLLALVGHDTSGDIDGMNVWNTIAEDSPSPRKEILHNIDSLAGESAVRVGDWKLLQGMIPGQWYPQAPETPKEDSRNRVYLFNIREDPCERKNLAESMPHLVKELQDIIERYNRTALPPNYPNPDPEAQPKDGVWKPWR